MSKFFEALQQAERERVLERQAALREASGPADGGTGGTKRPETGAAPEAPSRNPAGFATAGPVDTAVAVASLAAAPGLESELAGHIDEHLVSLLTPAAFGVEQYRAIRYVVEEKHKSTGLTVLAIASPGLEDGKTTTAINLAGTLAQAPEARVLLVEADLRRPSVTKYMGLDGANGPGLVDVILQHELPLESAVRVCAPFNLAVVPAGNSGAGTYELLKSPRLGQLLEEARRSYDYVIVDTPPLCPIPDGRVVAKCADGVLLVASAHKTPRKLVEEALDLLPAQPIAIIFNGDDEAASSYYSTYDAGSKPGRWTRFVNRWWARESE